MSALRIVFFGTPAFALPTLEAILAAGHDVIAVYTQPPRATGRGHHPQPSPVQAAAETRGLAVRMPASLKPEAEHAAFARLRPDVAVVIAYGLILPRPILDVPRLGCLNVHASLLPRWRGAAPIQHAILAGDAETGISIMRLDEGLDTGPVYCRVGVPIEPAATAGSLHDQLARLGAALMVEVLAALAEADDEQVEPVPQNEAGATYAAKIGPADGRLDWRDDAESLERRIRALNPTPGAWFEFDGERIKVWAADVVGTEGAFKGAASAAAPGLVLDQRLTVACGRGALRLTRLQRPGRSALGANEFSRGFALPAGTFLD